MAVRRDEAIILRTRDYSESDRLITFFTRNQGQLTGIAKGARRSKKRFVHTLEPLSHVFITYADRRTSGLVRLDASELKKASSRTPSSPSEATSPVWDMLASAVR
jgi:DNA repair protein RecO (recombination protein O)